MKGKFLNTKNVVIGLVSLVLIAASVTGVTVFLKNRGQAEAAGEQVQNLPATGREEQDNNQVQNPGTTENPDNQNGGTEIPGIPVEPTTPGTTPSAEPNQTTSGNSTTGNTERPNRENTNIQETEIERTNTTISEASTLGWTTIALSSITTDNMGLFKPELSISKTATEVIKNSDSEVAIQSENVLPSVKAGDEIIYTIRVENNGNYVAKDIIIKDMLPVVLGTRVSQDSDEVTFENQPVIPANTEIAKLDLEAKKAAILKVKYTVTQEDIDNLENTSIANIATVTLPGEDPIEDGDTSIEKEQEEDYEIYKISTLNKKDGNKDEKAEVGDTITYTITVENTGTVTLEDLNVIDEMIELDEKITLKPGDKKVFEKDYEITASDIAKALDNDSKIKNTAVVEYKDNEDKPGKNEEDVKTSYNLTINYVYENGETASKTYTNTLNYLASYNVTSPEITGYKTETTVVEGEMPAHDVTVTVVYVKDATQTKKVNYKVEYYKDGVKVDADSYTTEKDVWVNAPDTVVVDPVDTANNKYVGYKFENTDPSTIPAEVATGSVIKVYYVKDETQTKKVNYKVEYYKDGVKVDADSYTTEKDVWVNAPDTVVVDPVDTRVDKYVGYKLANTDPSTIPAEVATGSVIKVYYVKDETQTKKVNYKVEYYKDGVKVDADSYTTEKDVWVNAPDTVVVDPVDTRVDKYVGYKFENTDPSTIPAEVATGSVIKVYYVKDETQTKKVNYKVEYYKDGVKVDADSYTTEKDVWVNAPDTVVVDPVDTRVDKYVGYKFENTDPSTIPAEVATGSVIKVYYVKDETQTKKVNYKVEYYKDGVKVDADSYTTEKDVWVNAPDTVVVDPVDTRVDKYVGYKFENTDPSTIPAEVATGSVIKVYYVKDETQTKKVNYKVEYYKDGVKVNADSYKTEKDVWVNAPDTVVVDPVDTRVDKYVGYKLANTDPSTIPAEVATGSVIKVYYVKDSFSYSVEYYYDGVKDDNKKETATAEYDSIITTYEDKVITGYVLERVTPVDNNNNVSLRITENADNNVIRVYYVKDNFDYTVEYYKDTISEANKLGETGKISKPYGTVLTEKIVSQDLNDTNWINAEKPTGYKDGEVQEYITIDTANNVIRVLYEKRTDLHYTVKYYYNNEYKSEYTKTATYNSTINVNNVEDRSIDGNNVQWHLLELKPSEITIGLDESENVIEVYYVLPNITVTKSIWQNGKDVTDKTIEAGSTVTYKLTASNTGYENGSVTITDEQIPEGTIKTEDVETVNKLKANGIVLEVPANSSETIEFTLTLTGKIGTAISNTAEFDGTPTNTVNNEVEKTVQLKANSETVQITNSNVIVIIDTSGSMSSKPVALDGVCEKLICFKNHVYRNGKNYHYHYKDEPTKINNAKQVTKDFIDMIELPAEEDKSSSAIEVIQFNSDASIVGTATKASDVADLKSSIDKISLKGQTNVTNALTLASTEIDKLKQERPDNQNIVIFVSDGYPEGDTMTNIKNAAAKLHGKATVYAIGLDMDIDVLKTVVASDPSKYKTTLQASSLKDIFQDIKTDIVGKYKPTQSVAGKIELTDIDMTKSIIIKVNGKEIPAADIDSKLIKDETNKKYYVDLNQFSLSDEVTVEYTKTK